MILEEWNNGYWLTEMYVKPSDNGAVINEAAFTDLQHELYEPGQLDDEIHVRIEDRYFQLAPSADTPTGTLELSFEVTEELSIYGPEKRPVLVVKPWFNYYIGSHDGVV